MMCVITSFDKNVATFMLQLFYDKNIMIVRKKKITVSDKPWQNMLHKKTIPSQQNLRY